MSKTFSNTFALLVCVAAVGVAVPAWGQQCHNGQCQLLGGLPGRTQHGRQQQPYQLPVSRPGATYDSFPTGTLFDGSVDRGTTYGGASSNDSRDRGTFNGNPRHGTSSYGASSFQAPDPRERNARPVSYRNDVASVRWEPDFRTGVQQSLQSGLPLLVQVSADWCGYCQKMKRDTLVDPTVMRDLNRGFVTVMLDADANRELVQQLNVKSLPSTLVILPSGRVVEHLSGYQSATALQTMLNRYQHRVELDTDRRLASR